MINVILIAIGGACGSLARYFSFNAITNFMRENPHNYFPFNTLIVNAIGSMLAGIFYYFMIKYFNILDEKFKNFVLIGFLGGFTTFSAFSLDFFRLFSAGHEALAFSYILLSVTLAILSLFLGFYLMKIIFI